MNEAAKLVSDAITDNSFKTVFIGGKAYTIYAPTIYVIGKILKPLSEVCMDGDKTLCDVIPLIPEYGPDIAHAVAIAIVGDCHFGKYRSLWLKKRLIHSTPKELSDAFGIAVSLIQGQDFFQVATLAEKVANQMAKQK